MEKLFVAAILNSDANIIFIVIIQKYLTTYLENILCTTRIKRECDWDQGQKQSFELESIVVAKMMNINQANEMGESGKNMKD